MTAGATLGIGATGFFVMLAGYQYSFAGGSVRAIESAKGCLFNALLGFAIVIMCKVIAGLVGGALGAPGAGGTTGMALGLTTWMLWPQVIAVESEKNQSLASMSYPPIVEDQLIAGLTARQLLRLLL